MGSAQQLRKIKAQIGYYCSVLAGQMQRNVKNSEHSQGQTESTAPFIQRRHTKGSESSKAGQLGPCTFEHIWELDKERESSLIL